MLRWRHNLHIPTERSSPNSCWACLLLLLMAAIPASAQHLNGKQHQPSQARNHTPSSSHGSSFPQATTQSCTTSTFSALLPPKPPFAKLCFVVLTLFNFKMNSYIIFKTLIKCYHFSKSRFSIPKWLLLPSPPVVLLKECT